MVFLDNNQSLFIVFEVKVGELKLEKSLKVMKVHKLFHKKILTVKLT